MTLKKVRVLLVLGLLSVSACTPDFWAGEVAEGIRSQADQEEREARETRLNKRLDRIEQALGTNEDDLDCAIQGDCEGATDLSGLPFTIPRDTCTEPRPQNPFEYPVSYYPVYIEYNEEYFQKMKEYCGSGSPFPVFVNNKMYVASVKSLAHAQAFVNYIESNTDFNAGWQVDPGVWIEEPNSLNPVLIDVPDSELEE